MKLLFALSLLLAVESQAQDCDKLVFKLGTGFAFVNDIKLSSGLACEFVTTGKTGKLTLKFSNYCFEKGDELTLIFNDTDKIKLINSDLKKCSDRFTCRLDKMVLPMNFYVSALQTKKLSEVKLFKGGKMVNLTISKDNADTFYKAMNCCK